MTNPNWNPNYKTYRDGTRYKDYPKILRRSIYIAIGLSLCVGAYFIFSPSKKHANYFSNNIFIDSSFFKKYDVMADNVYSQYFSNPVNSDKSSVFNTVNSDEPSVSDFVNHSMQNSTNKFIDNSVKDSTIDLVRYLNENVDKKKFKKAPSSNYVIDSLKHGKIIISLDDK